MRNLVIIPAYNEEEALPRTVAALQALPEGFELLVINDGSDDGTGKILDRLASETSDGRRPPLRVVHLPVNCGIGAAVQTGYLFAAKDGRYKYVVQFDADGQHDAGYVAALVKECEAHGLDLCVGSRFLDVSDGGSGPTLLRRWGIRFFCRLISVLSGIRVTDPTSGFRCAGPRAWARFAEHYPDDYPEPETLFWCIRNRLKVGEIPVRMHRRQGGVSSIRYLRTVYYMLKVSLAILIDRLRAQERY